MYGLDWWAILMDNIFKELVPTSIRFHSGQYWWILIGCLLDSLINLWILINLWWYWWMDNIFTGLVPGRPQLNSDPIAAIRVKGSANSISHKIEPICDQITPKISPKKVSMGKVSMFYIVHLHQGRYLVSKLYKWVVHSGNPNLQSIYFLFRTNTFSCQFGQIHFELWTNTL